MAGNAPTSDLETAIFLDLAALLDGYRREGVGEVTLLKALERARADADRIVQAAEQMGGNQRR